MKLRLFPVLLLAAAALTGCSVLTLSPLINEDRVVTPLANQTMTVTFKEPMVWSDQGPTRGIRFPAGTYLLEAEDSQYRYFRAPGPLEYRIFQNGATTDDRFMPGGFFLSKAAIDMVPAGAYLSTDDSRKTLTWKLGGDFLRMEGSRWTKNF